MGIDINKLERSFDVIKVQLKEVSLKEIRRVAFAIDGQLVANTPKDTGRAQANWLPALNVPNRDKIGKPGNRFPNAESLAAERILAVTRNLKLGDRIYLSNNLPYIQRLNDGHSKQAPIGFVERAVQVGRRSLGL